MSLDPGPKAREAVRVVQGVYLLHFDPPYKHAGHYLGWSEDIVRRVRQHLSGSSHGNPLVAAAVAGGCNVTLARIWPGATRTFERQLKNKHGLGAVCPVCRPDV